MPLKPLNPPAPHQYLSVPPAGSGQRVGLFGGSFNPPHEGHVHVCEQALRRLQLDWVWWMVSPGNPLKDHSQLAPLSSRLHASEKLAINPKIKVTAFEASMNSRYTADTLTQITRQNPCIDFVWIMGADNLGQFHRWERWQEIASLMPFAVIDRPGSTMALHSAPAAITLSRSRIDEGDAATLPGSTTPKWTFLHGPRSSLSSTALRAAKTE